MTAAHFQQSWLGFNISNEILVEGLIRAMTNLDHQAPRAKVHRAGTLRTLFSTASLLDVAIGLGHNIPHSDILREEILDVRLSLFQIQEAESLSQR